MSEHQSPEPKPTETESKLQELLSQMTTLQVANIFIER